MSSRIIVVIGAGAAGLTAAIRAAESGASVTLLNAHPRIGLKILMSGGTRCNVTHARVEAADYFGGSRNVVARMLRAFSPEQTLEWFEQELGVPLKLEETGKYFPVSDDAQSVLDALLAAADRAGVATRSGARVTRIERRDAGGFRIGVQTVRDASAFGARVAEVGRTEWPLPEAGPNEWMDADRVILATGGLSFPRTGSDGTGYALAQSLGHSIATPIPALTPLTSDDPWCVMLQGLTAEVELSLRVAGKMLERVRGSMLWTHFGYSGPAALDLSRHWLRLVLEHGRDAVNVTLNVTPGESDMSWERKWIAAAVEPKLTVRRFLGAWLPDRLGIQLAAESGIGPAKWLSQVPRDSRTALLRRLVARPMRVDGTLGYEKAEVTAGGVPLEEVNASTLESRKCPGLFLCGEILDVEGRLGGFNFQWAWSSGTVAGRSAGR